MGLVITLVKTDLTYVGLDFDLIGSDEANWKLRVVAEII